MRWLLKELTDASSDFTCDVDYPGNVGSKSCLGSVSYGSATGIQRKPLD